MSGYVELHAASAFSFLRGATMPDQLAAEAAQLGLPAVALLDRDGVYGAARFYGAARDAGIRPLVGAEVLLEDGGAVPLLALNRRGYQNLCQLISTAKLTPRGLAEPPTGLPPGADPRERKRPCFATWAELAQHSDGLVALTGDEEGPVRRAYRIGGDTAAQAALGRLRHIFGTGRLHVELQRHRVRGEDATERVLRGLAEAHGLPLLATGGVLHATRGERMVADVFACLRQHTTLDVAGRRLTPNGERHLRGPAEMRARFADLPAAVEQSVRLADQLEFTLHDLGYRFPDFPVAPGETMAERLRAETLRGARQRLRTPTPKVAAQLEKELALINRLGFAGYFLIVADICDWCRREGILIQGRGSAANSAVCFVLGITAVNPVEHELLFERFLSEGRVGHDGHPSWPDVDLDLPSGERRERAIQEIFRRYGQRGAAMVANVITFRGRSAAREVGKVLDLPAEVLDRFSSLYANGDWPETIDVERQLELAGLPTSHPRIRAMATLCRQIRGLPRHLGQHSGGLVLCPGRLDAVVPIEPATMPGRSVVQWDKDDCEDLGLVKIDFLGLGMMAVLQESLAASTARGRPLTLPEIPTNDPATYAAMQRADTIGVFQIESRAQMATLPKFKPATFYDVAIEVAIVRPGPIVGKLTHPLLARRAAPDEPYACLDASVDALLRPVLQRTYGVILFQEQMIRVAMELAKFTGAEAEELRRALGFQRDDGRLRRITEKLRVALQREQHSAGVVTKVIDSLTTFAAYGFPESHALSFGLLAYASMWLKVHRPAEFLAALLNNQPMGFYSPATLVQDARRHGVKVRPVEVRHSAWACTVEADAVVRLGFSYVQGVKRPGVEAMEAARVERPFASLGDFLSRTTFTAAERRALAAVGALNGLAEHRRAALWQVEAAWTPAEELFLQAGLDLATEAGPLAPMSLVERHEADYRAMALTTGAHPMALVRDREALREVWRAGDLPLGKTGDRVEIAGCVICRQRPGTAKGFVFVSLEDETGVANAIVTPDLFERLRLVINEEAALRIGGRLQNEAGVIHVKAETIAPLHFTELPVSASHDFR